MASPFLAEIRMMGCNFAPRNNAFCNGQILAIAQNTALFSLLGTTYGGNGTTTFALPNLMGRAPMHPGSGPGLSPRDLGEQAGEENITLIETELPLHTHLAGCVDAAANQYGPGGNIWARDVTALNVYGPATNLVAMSPVAIAPVGQSGPHNNRQPYLAINFIIATGGIFPARN